MSKQVAVLGGVIVVLVGVVASLVLRSEPTPVPESVPEQAPVITVTVQGLQPKFEVGFVVEAPCPEHGVDVLTVSRFLVAYELTVEGSPFPVLATEEQLDAVLAQPK
jgi:hypothetical protein